MADYNPAVSLNINSPDPQQGLNTLSKIMGLSQQGLAIKGQLSENVTRAAAATEAAQGAKERIGLANLIQDPVGNGITDNEGNELPGAKNKILAVAPTTGAQHYANLVNASKSKVEFNSAVNGLRTTERAELANGVSGMGARAQSPDEIISGLDDMVEAKKGTPEYANYQTIAGTMKTAITHMADKSKSGTPVAAGQEPWRRVALNIGASILPAPSTVGPGGVANQGQANTGAGVVNRDPITGAISAPPGAPPGSPLNPTPPQVAGASARAVGPANSDIDRSNQVSAAVAPASRTILLTKAVDDLADQIGSGKISAAISKAAAAAGIESSTYARQVLEKDLGQLKATASSGAGTDQRQATILSGFPETTSDSQTIHTAMDLIRGTARQDLARGALLNRVKGANPDLRGYQQADDMLTGQTNPLMHEFLALKPEERAGFYRRNFSTPEAAQDFKHQVNAIKEHSKLLD